MLLPNLLPNRRGAQHPNTYAQPEGTSSGELAQGLKEGGKQALNLTDPGLHRRRPTEGMLFLLSDRKEEGIRLDDWG